MVCLLGGARVAAQTSAPEKKYMWVDGNEKPRTQAELVEILRLQTLWGNSSGRQGKKADLSGASLEGLDLSNLSLRAANLRGASLYDANLSQTNLDDADLRGAKLSGVDFSGASLLRVNFTNASLFEADLRYENLESANLSGTDLRLADLRHANLSGVNLHNANLLMANLSGARYEPEQPPLAEGIAAAKGLDELAFTSNLAPLSVLKKSLSDAGYVQQVKLVSASIHRHQENSLERALFDWTCEWGADWVHPLKLLVQLCLFSAPLYWVGLHLRGRGGLYVVSTGQRVLTNRGKEHWRRVSVARSRRLLERQQRWLGTQPAQWKTRIIALNKWIEAEVKALGTAFLFSMMAALNLGFHDFNFGRWIRMLQPREFDLRARGWMRVAAGVQSLIGLYLVALSLLSYFGHPFD
jgi:uncharacterized protein YjbI with pentapeptide repeats